MAQIPGGGAKEELQKGGGVQSVRAATNPLFSAEHALEVGGSEDDRGRGTGSGLLPEPSRSGRRLSVGASLPKQVSGDAQPFPPLAFSIYRKHVLYAASSGAALSTGVWQASELGVAIARPIAEASQMLTIVFVVALWPLLLWGVAGAGTLRRAAASYAVVTTNVFLVANLVIPWVATGHLSVHATLQLAAANAAFLNLSSLCASRRLVTLILLVSLLSLSADVARSMLEGDRVILSAGGAELTLNAFRRSALMSVATSLALALAGSVRSHNGRTTNPLLPVAAMQWEALAEGAAGLPPFFLTRTRVALEERRRAATVEAGTRAPRAQRCWAGPQWMAPRPDPGAQPTPERVAAAWRIVEAAATASFPDVAEEVWSVGARRRHRGAAALSTLALLVYAGGSPQSSCLRLALSPVLGVAIGSAVALLFWRNVTRDTARRAALSPGMVATAAWVAFFLFAIAGGAFMRPADGAPLLVRTCEGVYRLATSSMLAGLSVAIALQAAMVTRSPRLEAAITGAAFLSQLLNVVMFTVSDEFTGPTIDLLQLPAGNTITYNDAMRAVSFQICVVFARSTALTLREVRRHSARGAGLHISRSFVNSAFEVATPRPGMLDAFVVELAEEYTACAAPMGVVLPLAPVRNSGRIP